MRRSRDIAADIYWYFIEPFKDLEHAIRYENKNFPNRILGEGVLLARVFEAHSKGAMRDRYFYYNQFSRKAKPIL